MEYSECNQRVVKGTRFADMVREQVLSSIIPERMNPNGHGRRFIGHTPIGNDITNEVFSLFGINKIQPEPMFGNFIGNHYLDAAAVHLHKDPAPKGFHHVRCNIAIEMPSQGGHPILDGKTIEIESGDIWICFASIEAHSSTPIKGGQRVTLSLGALVEQSLAEEIYGRITANG